MPVDWLAIGAALLTGLLGSGHCAAMCGGIATGYSCAAPKASWLHAMQTNLGRVLGYSLAGGMAGGIGHAVVRAFRWDLLTIGLRMAVGVVLVIVAIRLLDRRGRLGFLGRPGTALWQRLRPLQRRLVPANTAGKRVGLGMLWGWLPCGLSGTMLAAAWLQSNTVQGALTMAAFGAGTLPVMVPLTWSGARLGGWLRRPEVRYGVAGFVLTAGLVTLAAPWLMGVPQLHGLLAALGCQSLPS